MRFCINPITFGDVDYPAAIEAAAAGGFEAVELWLPHVEAFLAKGHSPAEARAVLADNGLKAVGACFVAGLLTSTGEAKRQAFDVAKARFELCQALGADTIICVGDGPQQPTTDDYAHAAEQAREIGDLASSFELTVAIEFAAGTRFLATLATAARLVRDAEHAALGIAFDFFHFYAGPSKLADFDRLDGVPISFVHLTDAADVPREMLRGDHRVLPGEGCFPVEDLVRRLQRAGYDGYYSLELFNPALRQQEPSQVARAAFEACQRLASRLAE